jgi:hypothetical protein
MTEASASTAWSKNQAAQLKLWFEQNRHVFGWKHLNDIAKTLEIPLTQWKHLAAGDSILEEKAGIPRTETYAKLHMLTHLVYRVSTDGTETVKDLYDPRTLPPRLIPIPGRPALLKVRAWDTTRWESWLQTPQAKKVNAFATKHRSPTNTTSGVEQNPTLSQVEMNPTQHLELAIRGMVMEVLQAQLAQPEQSMLLQTVEMLQALIEASAEDRDMFLKENMPVLAQLYALLSALVLSPQNRELAVRALRRHP